MAKQKQINSLGNLMSQASEGLSDNSMKSSKVNSSVGYTSSSNKETNFVPQKGKVGRKPSNRTIGREKGLCIYLEESHREKLNRIGGFDKQDIIRTALDEFFKKYLDGWNLSEVGREKIQKYIESTTNTKLNTNENLTSEW